MVEWSKLSSCCAKAKPFYERLYNTTDQMDEVVEEEFKNDICMYDIELRKNTLATISSIILGIFLIYVWLNQMSHAVKDIAFLLVIALGCIFYYKHPFILNWRNRINECRNRTLRLHNNMAVNRWCKRNGMELKYDKTWYYERKELETVRWYYYNESYDTPTPWDYAPIETETKTETNV